MSIIINNKLEWSKYIHTMTNMVNAKVVYLRRNLKGCPQKLKQTAYFSLVLSFLEYSATIWDPHQKNNIEAVWFVKSRYSCYSIAEHAREAGMPFSSGKARKRLPHSFSQNMYSVPYEHILKDAHIGTGSKHSKNCMQIG